MDQTNSGVWYWDVAGGSILIILVIKLIAPKIDGTPAKGNEKLVKSIEGPLWAKLLVKGSHTVHPVPTSALVIDEARASKSDDGRRLPWWHSG